MPIIDAEKLRALSLSIPIIELVYLVGIDVPMGIGSTPLEELEWVALYSVKQRTQSEGIAMTHPALEPEHMILLSHMHKGLYSCPMLCWRGTRGSEYCGWRQHIFPL